MPKKARKRTFRHIKTYTTTSKATEVRIKLKKIRNYKKVKNFRERLNINKYTAINRNNDVYLYYDHTFIIIKQLQISTNGLINDIQTRLERQSNYVNISSVSSSIPSTNDKCESVHGINKALIKSKPNLNDVSCENITIAQSNQTISFLLILKQNNINEFNKILKIWIKMGSYCSKENNIIIHANQLDHEKQQYLLKKLNQMKEKLKRSQNYRLSKLQNVCQYCKNKDKDNDGIIICDNCQNFYHTSCLQFEDIENYNENKWICLSCKELTSCNQNRSDDDESSDNYGD